MRLFHNIRSVAKYEAKTLRRSWFFRLFSIGVIFILSFLNLGLFSPIGDEDWQFVSIPSNVPFLNLYMLNIAQSIVVIFLAADFLKRDKKVDTNEVLYTRSMSNLEYVLGKTAGILRLFIGLDIIILLIGLLMNIISKSMSVDWLSYIYYLLIICVPTIIFSLGLAFVLMSLIRNQAVTFLVLLGFAAMNMFWLWFRAGSLFDYMAFGLPLLKSTVTGFGNPELIINQRLLWFFLGMALVLATVLLFKRLPQSRMHSSIALVSMILFFSGAAVCGYNTYSLYINDVREKEAVISVNRQYENSDFVSLTEASIEYIQDGTTFEASAELTFINNNDDPLVKYLFSLNPYLKTSSITADGKELNFKQNSHIIEIDPASPLLPGKSDSLIISYSGSIDESFCYPDYSGNLKQSPYRVEMLTISKRQAFLDGNYVLLTPETHWYPVPSLNYYPSNPARIKVDFTRYRLRVRTAEGLFPVSQGDMKTENGYYSFKPSSPLTGLTLAIGDYKADTLIADSVKYIAYHFPGHDYYKKDLSGLADTLPLLVSGIMRDLETAFSTPYPFSELKLVEVPVQFYSYPRMNTQTRAELQPSMVLLPEKMSTLRNAGFMKRFTQQKKRMTRNNQVITDKELQVRLFNDFVRNTFISGQNFRYVNGVAMNEPVRYRLGPSFYFFKNNFYSKEYPVINAVFESHLQKQIEPQSERAIGSGGLSENDKANLILRNASFRDILATTPGSDTIRMILTLKGDYLFNLFRAKAGISGFNSWFREYIDAHKFQSIDIVSLNEEMRGKFGFAFYPYLNDWFNIEEQPGFFFSDLQVSETIADDRVRYNVTFVASNHEPVAGIFNISFRTGGQTGGGERIAATSAYQGGSGPGISTQGRGMESSDISRIIVLEPGEARRISIILDGQPREMMINTLFAKNIPGEIVMPVDEIRKLRNVSPVSEGEVRLESLPQISEPGEIVVDNEDPGFSGAILNVQIPLKKILGVKKREGFGYDQVNMYWAPETWQPVVQSSYYGKYIRSAVYTRGASGERSVSWKTGIPSPGHYDVFTYIGKSGSNTVFRRGGSESGDEGEKIFRDLHFKIHHDEGTDEITLDFENAEPGWNMLGRYYFSSDSALVELTNKTSGRMVIGDAVKWVKVK
jgi:ABC-type transport system involved in multi-copper enzyme maturation permease subunit